MCTVGRASLLHGPMYCFVDYAHQNAPGTATGKSAEVAGTRWSRPVVGQLQVTQAL